MIPSTLYISSFKTGSNYICNPPVINTDIDEMFLVHSLDTTYKYLKDNGWDICGSDEYDDLDNWFAFRKGNLNALITNDLVFYTQFEAATELAKKRNLLNKSDRIALFNLIMQGVK